MLCEIKIGFYCVKKIITTFLLINLELILEMY
jgi:hypothetical protein